MSYWLTFLLLLRYLEFVVYFSRSKWLSFKNLFKIPNIRVNYLLYLGGKNSNSVHFVFLIISSYVSFTEVWTLHPDLVSRCQMPLQCSLMKVKKTILEWLDDVLESEVWLNSWNLYLILKFLYICVARTFLLTMTLLLALFFAVEHQENSLNVMLVCTRWFVFVHVHDIASSLQY